MNGKQRRKGKPVSQETLVVLDESLDIGAVGVLRARLLEALAAGTAVTLDAAAVQQIDTAGLQLLCALVRSAAEQKLPVTWVQPAPALCERARLLGLETALGLPAVADATA